MFGKAIAAFFSSSFLILMLLPILVSHDDKITYKFALSTCFGYALAITLADCFVLDFEILAFLNIFAVWALIGAGISLIPTIWAIGRLNENQGPDIRTIWAVVGINSLTSGLICVIFDMIKQAAR